MTTPADCRPTRFSSRACERGTNTCTVRHGAPPTNPQRLDEQRLLASQSQAYLTRVVDAIDDVPELGMTSEERAGMDRMRAELRTVRESVGQRYAAVIEATRAAEREAPRD